jgi:hypothetical protein
MWIGDQRGHLVDWSTQRWVQATGRRVSLDTCPWLEGPTGKPAGIGAGVFDEYLASSSLRVRRGATSGLLPDFACLRSRAFDPAAISPAVIAFYQETSEYGIDAWSQWCGAFRPFGFALARIFSRRLEQLNVPLSGLETSRGMTSRVEEIVDPKTGYVRFTAWIRALVGTGRVMYAGAYSACTPPNADGPCVRVVFPLPNGNAIVIMRPAANPDGSFVLVSAGDGFGSPGFYFTVRAAAGEVWARYVPSFRETIRVFADADADVRADHDLTLWRAPVLRLHYRLRRAAPVSVGGFEMTSISL